MSAERGSPSPDRSGSWALAEQVKLLAKTEQRLYRAQRSLEVQLLRVESLHTFALQASRARNEAELLEQALEILLDTYPYDQALAFVVVEETNLRITACASVKGRGGDAPKRLSDTTFAVAVPVLDLPQPMHWRDAQEASLDARTLAVFRCFERVFADIEPRSTHGCLLLPLFSGGKLAAVLAARKVDTMVVFTQPLPTDEDLPFWELLTRHVESMLAALRARARLETVLAHLPSATLVVRRDTVVAANRAAALLLGFHGEREVEGTPLSTLVPADELAALHPLAEGRAADAARRLIARHLVRRDGERVPVEIVAVPLDFEGSPATLLIAEDMTERALMHTELAHAERLATVGVLAAGVAHEINNPLTYMLFHLEQLARSSTQPEQQRTTELVLDGATRIRDIVRDLKTFATVTEEQPHAVNVASVVEKVLALAEPEVRYRARVECDLGPLPPVVADETRLAQVFLNLVINAAHAMDAGRAPENRLFIKGRHVQDRVIIDVADTGTGIAPADLKRIFEPFFSTKDGPHGSGLGLSISRNIIERFGGRIEVTSALGQGTRFSVYLVEAEEESSKADTPEDRPRVHPTRLRVLVVDDDEKVLSVCAALLAEHYEVETALGGAEALKALARPFSVVVCDLMMPQVTGMEVHDWIRRNRPELEHRIVFLTGGSFTPKSDEFLEETDAPVIEKPMRAAALLAAIADVTARG